MTEIPKGHIRTKVWQIQKIRCLNDNLSAEEIPIHLDYSENCKSKDQIKNQKESFGNKPSALFTGCFY